MKTIIAVLFAAVLASSCSSDKGLGKTIQAQIDLKLPKDSTGKPIPISQATIGQIWPAVEPFYTSIEGLILLLPNIPATTTKSIEVVHNAISLAISKTVPPAGYTGINDQAARKLWLTIDGYINSVIKVFAMYMDNNLAASIINIRGALSYVVMGDTPQAVMLRKYAKRQP